MGLPRKESMGDMVRILFKVLRKVFPAGLRNRLRLYEHKMRLRHILRQLDNLIKYNRSDHFRSVDAENITACNRRCSYCPNSSFDRGLMKNKKLMEAGVFYRIIDELSKINFAGRITPNFYGEPLLDERLPELMAYARRRLPRANLVIFTNGDFLTLDLYKRLAEAGVNKFVISQHGQTMPEGVKEVMGYRREKGKDSVEITYAVMEDSSCLSNRGGLVHPGNIIKMKYCLKGAENLTIDYAGNILLCCNDYLGSVKFGNVGKETISDIWNKPDYKKIRKELKRGIFRFDICKRCICLCLTKKGR